MCPLDTHTNKVCFDPSKLWPPYTYTNKVCFDPSKLWPPYTTNKSVFFCSIQTMTPIYTKQKCGFLLHPNYDPHIQQTKVWFFAPSKLWPPYTTNKSVFCSIQTIDHPLPLPPKLFIYLSQTLGSQGTTTLPNHHFTHSLTHFLTNIHSLTHFLTNIHSLTHFLTNIHSLAHSLTPYLSAAAA